MYNVYSNSNHIIYNEDQEIQRVGGTDISLEELWKRQQLDHKMTFTPKLGNIPDITVRDYEAEMDGVDTGIWNVSLLMKYENATPVKKLSFIRGVMSKSGRIYENEVEDGFVKVFALKTKFASNEAVRLFCNICHSVGLYVNKTPTYLHISGDISQICNTIDYIVPAEQYHIAKIAD